jgi:calcineurin-like phosphoesterase family protein
MRYFCSDQHFFHHNIVDKFQRKGEFADVHAMNEHIIKMWNRTVKKKDLVYVIGDFSFGKFDETKAIVERLHGLKVLIRGNHDYRWTSKQFIEMGFQDVRDELVIKIDKHQIFLKHYPYAYSWIKYWWKKLTGRVRERPYKVFFPIDKGLWQIHGHHHGGPKVNGRKINVSVETLGYRPISEAEIAQIIANSGRQNS